MTEHYKIQTVRPDHADAIVQLLAELGYPGQDVSQVLQRISKFKDDLNSHNIVIVKNDINSNNAALSAHRFASMNSCEVVGLASFYITPLFHTDGNLGRITALVVAEMYRGLGLGKLLIHYLEGFALRHDCARMELTSSQERVNAHQFYLNSGFKSYDGKRFIKDLAMLPSPQIK